MPLSGPLNISGLDSRAGRIAALQQLIAAIGRGWGAGLPIPQRPSGGIGVPGPNGAAGGDALGLGDLGGGQTGLGGGTSQANVSGALTAAGQNALGLAGRVSFGGVSPFGAISALASLGELSGITQSGMNTVSGNVPAGVSLSDMGFGPNAFGVQNPNGNISVVDPTIGQNQGTFGQLAALNNSLSVHGLTNSALSALGFGKSAPPPDAMLHAELLAAQNVLSANQAINTPSAGQSVGSYSGFAPGTPLSQAAVPQGTLGSQIALGPKGDITFTGPRTGMPDETAVPVADPTTFTAEDDAPAAAAAAGGGGGAGAGGGTVICTLLRERGLVDHETLSANARFGRAMEADAWRGYQAWASPLVRLCRRSPLAFRVLYACLGWAPRAYMKSIREPGSSKLGDVLLKIGLPVCRWIGSRRASFRPLESEPLCNVAIAPSDLAAPMLSLSSAVSPATSRSGRIR